jgi:hypothetical protein
MSLLVAPRNVKLAHPGMGRNTALSKDTEVPPGRFEKREGPGFL